jgi:hypothetical protein
MAWLSALRVDVAIEAAGHLVTDLFHRSRAIQNGGDVKVILTHDLPPCQKNGACAFF